MEGGGKGKEGSWRGGRKGWREVERIGGGGSGRMDGVGEKERRGGR